MKATTLQRLPSLIFCLSEDDEAYGSESDDGCQKERLVRIRYIPVDENEGGEVP